MKMEADEVLLEFIHAELVSYAYNKAVSSNESSKKVGAEGVLILYYITNPQVMYRNFILEYW